PHTPCKIHCRTLPFRCSSRLPTAFWLASARIQICSGVRFCTQVSMRPISCVSFSAENVRNSVSTVMFSCVHLVGPPQEPDQFAPVAQSEPPEGARRNAIGVETTISLDAPPQIGATPGTEPIPFREPPYCAEHLS